LRRRRLQVLEQCRLADTRLALDEDRPRLRPFVGQESVQDLDFSSSADDRLHLTHLSSTCCAWPGASTVGETLVPSIRLVRTVRSWPTGYGPATPPSVSG